MTPSHPTSQEIAKEVVDKIISYSAISEERCGHVREYPDFQTWRNIIKKAIDLERAESTRLEAEVEKLQNTLIVDVGYWKGKSQNQEATLAKYTELLRSAEIVLKDCKLNLLIFKDVADKEGWEFTGQKEMKKVDSVLSTIHSALNDPPNTLRNF